MKCPSCGYYDTRVVDSRPTENEAIRRRRQCRKCGYRFTTYETYEVDEKKRLIVIKKDGTMQMFDRNKILIGLFQACYKRPVTKDTIIHMAADIEDELMARGGNEVTSDEIGRLVMEKLRSTDDVSYVRFASVYRKFAAVQDFRTELDELEKEEGK